MKPSPDPALAPSKVSERGPLTTAVREAEIIMASWSQLKAGAGALSNPPRTASSPNLPGASSRSIALQLARAPLLWSTRAALIGRSIALMRGSRPSRAPAACRWLGAILDFAETGVKSPIHGSFELKACETKIAK
jgi:hypothetical protein